MTRNGKIDGYDSYTFLPVRFKIFLFKTRSIRIGGIDISKGGDARLFNSLCLCLRK